MTHKRFSYRALGIGLNSMMQHLLEHHGSENLQRHSQIDISTHNLFLFLSHMWAVTTISADGGALLSAGCFFFLVFLTANFSVFISIRGVICKVGISKGLVLQPFLSGGPTPSSRSLEYKKHKMKQSTDTQQKVVFVSLRHFWLKVLRFFFFLIICISRHQLSEHYIFFIV